MWNELVVSGHFLVGRCPCYIKLPSQLASLLTIPTKRLRNEWAWRANYPFFQRHGPFRSELSHSFWWRRPTSEFSGWSSKGIKDSRLCFFLEIKEMTYSEDRQLIQTTATLQQFTVMDSSHPLRSKAEFLFFGNLRKHLSTLRNRPKSSTVHGSD